MAGPRPVCERADDAECAQHPGGDVNERDTGAHRRSIRLAGDRHHAAERLHHGFITCFMGARAGSPESGHRAVDQPGIELRQRVVAQPKLLHRSSAKILDQNIGIGDETFQNFHALWGFQVDRHATLVAVVDKISRRLPLLPG